MIQNAQESTNPEDNDGEVIEVVTETIAVVFESPMASETKGTSGDEGGTKG
jgi:hypothetical protein